MLFHNYLTSDFHNNLAVNWEKKSWQQHNWLHHILKQEVSNTNWNNALENHMIIMTLESRNLPPSAFVQWPTFEAYPFENTTDDRNYKKNFFSSSLTGKKNASPFLVLSPSFLIHRSFLCPFAPNRYELWSCPSLFPWCLELFRPMY